MNKNSLIVKFNDDVVGKLVLTKDKKVAFQYSDEWIRTGFSLNPFSLPLEKRVFIPNKTYFDGLFGVFADSMPDAWGNLLLDRMLRKNNIKREDVTVIDRLAIVGKNGMGCLTYEPAQEFSGAFEKSTLDELNIECGKILKNQISDKVDDLFKLGGSSGGARPKVLMNENGKNWLIKFPASVDNDNIGLMEFEYFKCARACGITVPETKLFPSNINAGYFGIERFDIQNNKKVHVATVAGLLELDYRVPSLDYNELLKLTKILTNGKDVYEMFRRMCFNVFAHNYDDHSKNFSFIYDPNKKYWQLSPAYDLTYSNTYFGEQTTTVNGKGRQIGDADLLKCGLNNNMDEIKCLTIIKEVKTCVNEMLKKYLN